MSDDMKLQRFEDLDGRRWIEVSEFDTYEDVPNTFEPAVEIEVGNYDGGEILALYTPEDALKLAHIIRKQAKLALREKWRRTDP